jgi:cyclomaltodextrinase
VDESGVAIATEHDTPEIRSGHYRHSKGNEYTVVGVARHSERLEQLVVYK